MQHQMIPSIKLVSMFSIIDRTSIISFLVFSKMILQSRKKETLSHWLQATYDKTNQPYQQTNLFFKLIDSS